MARAKTVAVKQCGACKEVKSALDFYNAKKSTTGLTSWCKLCCAKQSKVWYSNTQNKRKNYLNRIKNKYGVSSEEYQKMFDEQEGKCLICEKHDDDVKQRLHVDHCHQTGKVRGLLCFNCNAGMGNLGDDIVLLEKAIQYLKSYSQEN